MLKRIALALCMVAIPFASVSVASPVVAVQSENVLAARTVTTTVKADSSGEAIAIAKKRYPKGEVTGVRKSGSFWIVTLRIE